MLWGVSREERPVVRGAAGLVGCLCGRVWLRVFLELRAAIGVLWVRAYSSPPPFFLLLLVLPWAGGERKVAAWGECLVSSFV